MHPWHRLPQKWILQRSKGYRWAFRIAAVETEDIRQLSTLPSLSDDSCAVGLLRVEEQQVPIATTTVHRRQYRTDRDSVIPIHEMIRKLESQGVVSKARSPFNSPIWPVRKSSGEWRLTVDYRALNEVTPPLSAAVPDMLELQYKLESKAAKWYATIDIANAFFSIPLAAECRAQFAFTWKGVQYTWNRLPQRWKHSPTICHGLIQTALEKGEAPEHLQYIDDIIVWRNTAGEVFEKGEKIIQILLKAGFAIKRSKVKGPAQEIQFLGIKWQDGRRQIPTEVINKIIAMSPPTSKKETQAFLSAISFWRMHIPEYSQIVSPLYLVTRKKNDFHWGPEQQQAFAQIKQEIAHAVALGPVRTGPKVKNVLYSAAGNNGLSWSLWQKVPGETRGRPLGFWSRSYRGSEANYTPTEKEILAAYEGLQAASEVIGTETQLLLAPRLPVLGWMFKGKVPSTHHATDTTWSKWIALITQRARIGNPNRPGILEIITNWPEGETFRLSFEEEEEQVTRAEEAPPYNELPETERQYALFTDGSCRIVGANQKWKAAVWSPTRRVAQATEGQGGSSQVAELKAIQLALDIAEREKWPRLYLYTDSWMVANALWRWLNRWKKANWQRRGKPIWAAEIWQDIAARVEKLTVKVRHVDAHVSKSQANEEHHNNEQVDKAAKVKVSQVIHNCETCAAIKQAKRVKPLWYGGRWLKYRYEEAWQIDYITLPQTRQGKRYVLTMVEATTGWLETYPVPHATARNTILGLKKQGPIRADLRDQRLAQSFTVATWYGRSDRLSVSLPPCGDLDPTTSDGHVDDKDREEIHEVHPLGFLEHLGVLYHQEEEMYHFLEETILLRKREVMTGITIAMLLGLGATGTATGVSALVTQHQRLSQLQMTIDEDLLRIEKSISSLERSISSLSEVVLQNRRGLDLLLMQQGGLCAALIEECCFYADHTGVVRDSMAELRGRLAQRKGEREAQQGWFESWFNQSPWLATLVPTLIGPLTMILLTLIFGPCILNKLVSFVRRRLDKVDILFVERMQLS
ncbi:hypothetical protein DUI87_02097 [Hirundo rustica rustica]|uniref:ribonuclease H n=1 Tax=Hirundo rustica rustica TaxID=333673 RepID=A0A3M0L798_HIRRU|nr:hypothetical protein DUI87_02097 [Hirundo rustica rustica]